jgi:hypothetical protein
MAFGGGRGETTGGDGGERVRVGIVARAQIEMLADPAVMIKTRSGVR